MKKHRILEITWIDSAGFPGWQDRDDAVRQASPMKCLTVGYFMCEDQESVSINQTMSDNDSVDHVLVIPKSCITKRRRLS